MSNKKPNTSNVAETPAETIVDAPTDTPVVAAKTKPKPPTEAEKIWNDIKDQYIDMFSLPGQTISKYCSPVPVEPSKLYLTHKVSAVLPAMEAVLSNKYTIEAANKYIIIAKKQEV
jgi:hypothetical protein